MTQSSKKKSFSSKESSQWRIGHRPGSGVRTQLSTRCQFWASLINYANYAVSQKANYLQNLIDNGAIRDQESNIEGRIASNESLTKQIMKFVQELYNSDAATKT